MHRLITHLRHNLVAYIALFVALGGTSYAAFSVPRNSVGAAQIRNHSITHVKLNESSIAGTVEAWVKLQWGVGARIHAFYSSSRVIVSNSSSAISVEWPHRHFPRDCIASVTPQVNVGGGASRYGFVTASFDPTNPSGANVGLYGWAPGDIQATQAADVLIFCP